MVKGSKMTDEQRRKIGESRKGKGIGVCGCFPRTPELNARIGATLKAKYVAGYVSPNKGHKHTEEHRRNISDGIRKGYVDGVSPRAGIPVPEEVRNRISKSHLGVSPSPERVRKQSESLKRAYAEGRVVNPMKGRKRSAESKAKNSEAQKKKWENPDYRNKQLSDENRKKRAMAIRDKLGGDKNPSWNPNREEVCRNRIHRDKMWAYVNLPLGSNISDDIILKKLGYTKYQFIARIESTFKPGMNWQNHGRGSDKWHIDHVKPVSAFLKEGTTDPKIICALDNLQALWEPENLRKGAKYKIASNNTQLEENRKEI